MLSINRKLNLVMSVLVPPEPGVAVWVHSTPLMRYTFKTYYSPLARTFTRLFATPLVNVSGPRVASHVLEDESKAVGVWDDPRGANAERGVRNGLWGEIRRLTNVIAPSDDKGWSAIPYEEYLKKNIFTEDDIDRVENLLAFFIVSSAIQEAPDLQGTLTSLGSLWPVQSTPMNCTEYATSLVTQKKGENSGEKETASSTT
jgi:hypothetical protein